MRKYKFRGKILENFGDNAGKVIFEKGKWIYGGITYDIDRVWIDTPYYGEILVNRETVGQYTGLKDKNGKEIYEGDILLAPEWLGSLKCICIYQQENTVNPIQGFGLYSYDTYFRKYNTLVESDEWDEFEVIGNIYDNPELLEEGE